MVLLLTYLFLALIVSALCSVMEAVLLSTPQSFLVAAEKAGKGWAGSFLKLKLDIDKPLSAILTLNTVAHTVGAAGVGAQAIKVFGDAYFGIVSAVLTILILVFTEIIPKTAGARYWRNLAGAANFTIRGMIVLTYPLVIIAAYLTRLISRDRSIVQTSREEISALASLGAEEGIVAENENRIIQNILHLKNLKVNKIMTPRVVVSLAQEEMELERFLEYEEFYSFSRIPVYGENDDHVTGYVLRQEVLERLAEKHEGLKLRDVRREITIVPYSTQVFEVWETLLTRREHIALVVDEYGGTAGIVTMEDIIESLLGLEIVDEKDATTDMQEYAREKWRKRMAVTNYWKIKGQGGVN